MTETVALAYGKIAPMNRASLIGLSYIVGALAVAAAMYITFRVSPPELDRAALAGAVFAACTLLVVGFQVYLAWDENSMTKRQIKIMENQDRLLSRRAKLWIFSLEPRLHVPAAQHTPGLYTYGRGCNLELYVLNVGRKTASMVRLRLVLPPNCQPSDTKAWRSVIITEPIPSYQDYTCWESDFEMRFIPTDSTRLPDIFVMAGGTGAFDYSIGWQAVYEDGASPNLTEFRTLANEAPTDEDLAREFLFDTPPEKMTPPR